MRETVARNARTHTLYYDFSNEGFLETAENTSTHTSVHLCAMVGQVLAGDMFSRACAHVPAQSLTHVVSLGSMASFIWKACTHILFCSQIAFCHFLQFPLGQCSAMAWQSVAATPEAAGKTMRNGIPLPSALCSSSMVYRAVGNLKNENQIVVPGD